MNEKIIQNIGHSIAEEAQLLTEEKWIIQALNKIKKQRNSLQIERLQLESMKNQLRNTNISTSYHLSQSQSPPVTFSHHMMQNVAAQESVEPVSAEDHLLETEALCNKEELNLTATNSIFSQMPIRNLHMQLDEEEFDDEEDCEDLLIDMNMFMHGKQTSKSNLL